MSSAPTNHTPFRTAERQWKSRAAPLDLSLAFSYSAIIWSPAVVGEPQRGTWLNQATRVELVCVRLDVGELGSSGMGQSRWKGKEREGDFAVVFPTLPGLVLLPGLLPPPLQRRLTVESLRHSALPNLTSLSAHFDVGELWATWERQAGKVGESVRRKDAGMGSGTGRTRFDFDPVTVDNWNEQGKGRGDAVKDKPSPVGVVTEETVTIDELLTRIRWTTIGYSYDWTSKTYDFDRGHTPLPPTIHQTCRDVVRAVPWGAVFAASGVIDEDYEAWREYEPEAGVVNFYQMRDSLTAHIDQSELDAVRPLVSFSIGHSGIFLVGGPTRDTEPLPILLQSGDGLILSGKEGRRVFHGLPRILEGSLPEYLASTTGDEDGVDSPDKWRMFGEYLERGTRININVRQVLVPSA